MTSTISPKPLAEGFILSPDTLQGHITTLKAAYQSRPNRWHTPMRKDLNPVVQHFLAKRTTIEEMAPMLNELIASNFTRMSLAGYTWREKLVFYTEPTPEMEAEKAAEIKAKEERKAARILAGIASRAAEKQKRQAHVARVAAKPPPAQPVPPVLEEIKAPKVTVAHFLGRRIPLLLIKDGQCREITGIGKKDGKVLCCGQKTRSLLESYCSTHKLVNFQPSRGRRPPVYVAERVSKYVYFEDFAL